MALIVALLFAGGDALCAGLELDVSSAEVASIRLALHNAGNAPLRVLTRPAAFRLRARNGITWAVSERRLPNDDPTPAVVELAPDESRLLRFEVHNARVRDGTIIYRVSARDCADCWQGELRSEVAVERQSLALSLRAPCRATVGVAVTVKLTLANETSPAATGAPCRDVSLRVDDEPRPVVGFPCSDSMVYIKRGKPLVRSTTLTFDRRGEHVVRAFYGGLDSGEVESFAITIDVVAH